jgi:hypothetical protein
LKNPREEILKFFKEVRCKSNFRYQGVAQLPEGYEERLIKADIKLKHLIIRYPDKYDITISKISRLLGNDLDDILWIHKNFDLNSDVLLERYLKEFRNVYVGRLQNLDLNFLDVIEELFDIKTKLKIKKILDRMEIKKPL